MRKKNVRGKTHTVMQNECEYAAKGHMLLCSDGIVRSAKLAKEPDTYFSVPAQIKIGGETITGYMTSEEALLQVDHNDWTEASAYVFRHHDKFADKLPKWPEKFTDEHFTLVSKVGKIEG